MAEAPSHNSDNLMTEHLKDQFAAWFVFVLAGYYLLDYMAQTRKKKTD